MLYNWMLRRFAHQLINEAYGNGFLDGAEAILRKIEKD
jgi:hypothetical protein